MDYKKSKNKGYSFVEMVIVIAIIGIVSVMAIASISMIHSAKCKDAAVVFDSEISELFAKAKSMNDFEYGMYAIRVYKDGKNFYIQKGRAKKFGPIIKFKVDSENPNDYKGKKVTGYARISYTAENDSGLDYPVDWSSSLDATWTATTTIQCDGDMGSFHNGDSLTGVVIAVTKSGDVISGNGAYCFFRKNGSQVARVYVRKNGSHEAR